MFHSNKRKLQTRTDFAVWNVRELFQFSLQPPPLVLSNRWMQRAAILCFATGTVRSSTIYVPALEQGARLATMRHRRLGF